MTAYVEIIIGCLLALLSVIGGYMVKDGLDRIKNEKTINESITKADGFYNNKLYMDALKEYESIRKLLSRNSKNYSFVNMRIGFCELDLARTRNEGKEEFILKAIHALEDSLSTISEKELHQHNHLEILCNLGSAYIDISDFRDSENYLIKAMNVLESELHNIDKKTFPEEYASILVNLANTHNKYANIKDREIHLLEAKKNYDIVFKENLLKDKYLFSMSMNNYGNLLENLSRISNRVNYVKESQNAFKTVLLFFTLEEYPYEYAMVQNNLGLSYESLSKEENSKDSLMNAIKCYNESLKVRTREKYPFEYSTTQNNIGVALLWQATMSKPTNKKLLLDSKKAFEKSLETINPGTKPIDYAGYSHNLASLYLCLSDLEDKERNLRNSINANEAALKVLKEDKYSYKYKIIKKDLEIANNKLSEIK
jgi:hypothetical protein